MKKELFTAIGIGAIFGFIITAAFWAIQEGKLKDLLEKNITVPEETKETQEVTPVPQKEEESSTPEKIYLKIESPENESILTKSLLKIVGQTEPLATVVILHEQEDKITTANGEGKFEESIELNGGLNIIKVSSFTPEGESSETTLYLTYSTAKI